MLKKFSAFFVLFAIAIFFTIEKNQDKILSFKANECLKKNDIICAQKNFEKAFQLGFHNTSDREAYINTIINAPFDIEAQEKVSKFLSNNIEDIATLKLDYFLHDLKLEIFKKYTGNYIKQAVFNKKVLHWSENPITYKIENAPEKYFETEIEQAFIEWEKATEHKILFEKTLDNPNIVINFETKNPANQNSKKYIVAYTIPNIISNRLKNMEITFYSKDPNGNFLSKNQVYNTALHEIAHALGLMGHSSNPNDLMYMTRDSASLSKNSRTSISEADINTIKLLYKIKPDITNNETSSWDYLPFIVMGDEEEINKAKLIEAKSYVQKAPSIATGYIDLAESYVFEQNYPKAIKTLEKALEIANTEELMEMINYNLAVSYFYIDNMEIAKEYLLKSIKINRTEDKRFLLAEIYNKLGNKKLAEKEYINLIKINPNNIEYTIALTNLYISQKKYLKARQVLKKYFKLHPKEKTNPRFKPYGILNVGLWDIY